MLARAPAQSLPFTIAEDAAESVNDAPPQQDAPKPAAAPTRGPETALTFLEVDAGTALTLLEAAVTHCAYAHPPPARLRQLAAKLETLAARRERRAALTLTRCLRRVGKHTARDRCPPRCAAINHMTACRLTLVGKTGPSSRATQMLLAHEDNQ